MRNDESEVQFNALVHALSPDDFDEDYFEAFRGIDLGRGQVCGMTADMMEVESLALVQIVASQAMHRCLMRTLSSGSDTF